MDERFDPSFWERFWFRAAAIELVIIVLLIAVMGIVFVRWG